MIQARVTKGDIRSSFVFSPLVFFLVSTILYFSPILFGGFDYIYSDGERGFESYSNETVYVALFAIAALIFAIILFGRTKLKLNLGSMDKDEALAFLVLYIPAFGYTLLSPDLFVPDKSIVLESTNRIHLIFYYLSIAGVLFSVITSIRKHIFVFSISILGLALAMYIGHRSYAAIAVLGVSYILYRNRSIFSIKKRFLVLISLIFFGLVMYKPIYSAIKSGNYELVRERLSYENLGKSARIGSEQFLTFSILDNVVTHRFKIRCSNMWYVPISIIPFGERYLDLEECSFNGQIQPEFYIGYTGGVAANIWAEFYSNFDIFGIPLLILVVASMTLAAERVMGWLRSPMANVGLVVFIMQMTFYIQRNELLTAFTFGKRAIIVTLLVVVFAKFIRTIFGQARREGAKGKAFVHKPSRAF